MNLGPLSPFELGLRAHADQHGASLDDVRSAAAQIRAHLPAGPDQDDEVLSILGRLVGHPPIGSVAAKDLAREMARLG